MTLENTKNEIYKKKLPVARFEPLISPLEVRVYNCSAMPDLVKHSIKTRCTKVTQKVFRLDCIVYDSYITVPSACWGSFVSGHSFCLAAPLNS